MRYICDLTQETLKLLKRIYRHSKYYQVRQRAHCIQLSYQGYSIAELMRIFQVSRNTIYNWFNAWESSRFAGLYNHPGRGRKKLLNANQEQQIKKWLKETPKNLEKITKKTVLIMDNSSIHQNNLLWNKEEDWANKGLEIFFLPSYSPQLNIIEIFWRFIKYQWLKMDAYESYSNLVEAVEDILVNFGIKYIINFV